MPSPVKKPRSKAIAAARRLAREIIHGGEETLFTIYGPKKDPIKCLHSDRFIVAREFLRLHLPERKGK